MQVLETIEEEETLVRPCKCQNDLTQDECNEIPFCTRCYTFYDYEHVSLQSKLYYFFSDLVDLYIVYLFFNAKTDVYTNALEYYFFFIIFEMFTVHRNFEKKFIDYKKVSERGPLELFYSAISMIQSVNFVTCFIHIFHKIFVFNLQGPKQALNSPIIIFWALIEITKYLCYLIMIILMSEFLHRNTFLNVHRYFGKTLRIDVTLRMTTYILLMLFTGLYIL